MAIMKGFTAIKEEQKKGIPTLKLKDGEGAVIRFIQDPSEIISVYEYTEQIGGRWVTFTAPEYNEDPMRAMGKKPSFKTYFLVADRSDEDRVKIFKASKTVGGAITGLLEEYGDLRDRDFKIVRQGEKLKTTYQFFPKDKSKFELSEDVELPNLEEMLTPKTREEILAIMNSDYSEANEGGSESKDSDFPF